MASQFVIGEYRAIPATNLEDSVFEAVAAFDGAVDTDGFAELKNGRVRITQSGYYLVDAVLLVDPGYRTTAS